MTKILKTDPICLTMLRDPVEQYISTYAQLQRKELNSYIAKINLPKFIDNAPSQLLLHKINMRNRQSRMLAASYKFQDTTEMLAATSNYDSTRRPFLLNQELQITAKQLLPQAKSRLVNIAFFGLTERFRDSILNQKL